MTKSFSWVVIAGLVMALNGCNQSNIKPDDKKASPAAANVELGILYMREGKKNIAMDVLKKALTQDPNSADAHNAIAVLYESLGENDKADTHFKRALSLNSSDSQAHNNYGSFLCRTKRPDEADKHYMMAVANPLYETPELAYTNAGSCAFNSKDYAKAEQYWRKALEARPNFPPALLQMARLSVAQESYMGARAFLQRFHSIARPTAESLWLGIQTERVLGDKNAEASYSMLLKNGFPDSPQAKQLAGQ